LNNLQILHVKYTNTNRSELQSEYKIVIPRYPRLFQSLGSDSFINYFTQFSLELTSSFLRDFVKGIGLSVNINKFISEAKQQEYTRQVAHHVQTLLRFVQGEKRDIPQHQFQIIYDQSLRNYHPEQSQFVPDFHERSQAHGDG